MIFFFSPFIALFLIFEYISRRYEKDWGWRASTMMASLAWGGLLVIVTELAGSLKALNPIHIAYAWGAVSLILISALVWLLYNSRNTKNLLKQTYLKFTQWLKQRDVYPWVMLALLAVQASLLLLVALSYAPNTYETMTYHLPRVMHWLQGGSLANFATSNVRDVYFPPFAEFAFLNIFALTGGDHYVNIIQWGAFLFCLVAVSAIAAEMGANRIVQIEASLLAAGIPMAVLQATAARNDLIIAAWLLALLWFGLRWIRQPDSWFWTVWTGLSLGLAVLTKATSYIYALPIGVLIGFFVVKNGGFRPGIVRGGVVILLMLLLNVGHFSRNLAFYLDPVGIHERVKNDRMSAAVFVSNSIRNIAMHVSTDCKPPLSIFNQPGRWLLDGLAKLHALTGMNPTDAGTTWGYVDIFNRPLGCIYDEHFAGNALHALLIFCTCLILIFDRSGDRLLKWLGASLVVGFVLLNLTLRWQVWGSHLQLPLFILWMPVTALALNRIHKPIVLHVTALLAVVMSFLWIYHNQMRPLSGLISGTMPARAEQYFQYAPAYYPQFDSMTDLISESKCDHIGLHISSLAMEYPIWALLQEKGFTGVIQHVDVPNETYIYVDKAFTPCAIISEGENTEYAAKLTEHSFGNFYVYLNESQVNH